MVTVRFRRADGAVLTARVQDGRWTCDDDRVFAQRLQAITGRLKRGYAPDPDLRRARQIVALPELAELGGEIASYDPPPSTPLPPGAVY